VRNQYPHRDNQPDILFRQVEAPTPPPNGDDDRVTIYVDGAAQRVPRNSAAGRRELERRQVEGYAQSTQYRELSTSLHREHGGDSDDSFAYAAEPISSDDEEITLSNGRRVLVTTGVNPRDIPTLEELESRPEEATEEPEAEAYSKFKEEAEQIRKIWIDKLQLQQDQSTKSASVKEDNATTEERQQVPDVNPPRSIDIASIDLSNPCLRPEEPQPDSNIAENLVAQVTSEIEAILKGAEQTKEVDRARDSDYSPLELETTSSEDEAQPKHQ